MDKLIAGVSLRRTEIVVKSGPSDPPWWWAVVLAWLLNAFGDSLFKYLGAIIRSLWEFEKQQPQSLVQTVAVLCGKFLS